MNVFYIYGLILKALHTA